MQPTQLDAGRASPVAVTVRDPGVIGPIPAAGAAEPWRLRGRLAARFAVEGGPISAAGAEAAGVFRLRGRPPRVLKVYQSGGGPAPEVWTAWRGIESDHVVELLECGREDGQAFEVTRYVGRRSLRELIDEHPDGVGAERASGFVAQLKAALDALGEARIVHRDLKPENVLLDESGPGRIRLVVVDFGVSALLTLPVISTVNNGRTDRYAAPELFVGTAATKSDYWSLGMIVAELATGRHPLAGLPDGGAARKQIVQNAIPVAEEMEPRLRRLCLGLLVGDDLLRWGADEVARWLAGDDEMPAVPERAPAADRRPLRFLGEEFVAPAALAGAMVDQWTAAAEQLAPGAPGWESLCEWAAQFDEPGRLPLAQQVQSRLAGRSQPPGVALVYVVRWLDPGLSPQYRGLSMAYVDLNDFARLAAQGGPGQHQAVIDDLWEYDLLAEFDGAPGGRGLAGVQQRWHRAQQRWEFAVRQMVGRHEPLSVVFDQWQGPRLRAWLLWEAADPAGAREDHERSLAEAGLRIRRRLGGGRLDWFDEIVATSIDTTDKLAARAAATAAEQQAELLAAEETERRAGISARRESWRRREAWRRLDRPVALGWAAVAAGILVIALTTTVLSADALPFASDAAIVAAWAFVAVTAVWLAGVEVWLAAEIGAPYHPGYSLVRDLGRQARTAGHRFGGRTLAGLVLFIAGPAALLAVLLWAPWVLPLLAVSVHIASTRTRHRRWRAEYERRHAAVLGATDVPETRILSTSGRSPR